jgi:hypothetical protein
MSLYKVACIIMWSDFLTWLWWKVLMLFEGEEKGVRERLSSGVGLLFSLLMEMKVVC